MIDQVHLACCSCMYTMQLQLQVCSYGKHIPLLLIARLVQQATLPWPMYLDTALGQRTGPWTLGEGKSNYNFTCLSLYTLLQGCTQTAEGPVWQQYMGPCYLTPHHRAPNYTFLSIPSDCEMKMYWISPLHLIDRNCYFDGSGHF